MTAPAIIALTGIALLTVAAAFWRAETTQEDEHATNVGVGA